MQSSATLFDLAKKAKRIDALENESGTPEFWNDPAKAQRTMQELSRLKKERDDFARLKSRVEDIEGLVEMAHEDSSLEAQVQEEFDKLSDDLDSQEVAVTLSGPDDHKDAILTINA